MERLLSVLILSELWHPQGGGAELATYLYVKRMLDAGLKVTLLTNRDADVGDLPQCSTIKLPFGSSISGKPGLLMVRPIIERKASRLAACHDIAYITGKLLFLAPALKKANPSLRIIAHLHDYQLVCPHASLYNFVEEGRCRWIWDENMCRKCVYRYESVVRGGLITPFLGVIGAEGWKHIYGASKISEIIEHTDAFITVSNAQTNILSSMLLELSNQFLEKNFTIYNPVSSDISYVPPSFNNAMCLSCFSGDRYLKGFKNVINLSLQLKEHRQREFTLKIIGRLSKKKRIPLNNGIEILGYLSPEKIIEIYAQTWLVLFLSLWDEPLPYTIAEAQLRGRPVLTTSVGGINEEIVEPGLSGETVGTSVESFIEPLIRYSELLVEQPSLITKKISQKANIFFKARTEKSYKTFKYLLQKI